MNKQTQLIASALVLALGATSAMASDTQGIDFADEAKACIAAVNDRADYDSATRVRHNVIEQKNTFSGYVLDIDTIVFTTSDDVATRVYASHCVAKGDGQPRKFNIDKISG